MIPLDFTRLRAFQPLVHLFHIFLATDEVLSVYLREQFKRKYGLLGVLSKYNSVSGTQLRSHSPGMLLGNAIVMQFTKMLNGVSNRGLILMNLRILKSRPVANKLLL
jgi:hypothetical protein